MSGRLPGRLFTAAILFVAALVPVFGGAYLTTFLFTLLYAYIVAQSWDWLHGEAGYVNLGHYIYFGVGAYAFALANVNGVPVVLSFVFAALFTGLMGALLSFPLFRLRGDYFAFATLALLPLFELLASNLVPITRGIITTSYAQLRQDVSAKDIQAVYEETFKDAGHKAAHLASQFLNERALNPSNINRTGS